MRRLRLTLGNDAGDEKKEDKNDMSGYCLRCRQSWKRMAMTGAGVPRLLAD